MSRAIYTSRPGPLIVEYMKRVLPGFIGIEQSGPYLSDDAYLCFKDGCRVRIGGIITSGLDALDELLKCADLVHASMHENDK